jgi:hypothetical protein
MHAVAEQNVSEGPTRCCSQLIHRMLCGVLIAGFPDTYSSLSGRKICISCACLAVATCH